MAVSLDLLKEYLRVPETDTSTDATLAALLASVVEMVERLCGIRLSVQDCTDHLEGGGYALVPTVRPVVSVATVRDMVAERDLDEDEWAVYGDKIYRIGRERWETGSGRFRVAYKGGYAEVPEGLVQAILSLVGQAFQSIGGADRESAPGASVSWRDIEALARQVLGPYVRFGL